MSTNETFTAPGAAPASRQRSAGHVVAIVVGALALLPAVGALLGGAAIAVAQSAATDDDGYFTTTLDPISSDGVAVTTSETWFDGDDGDEEPWVFDWLDLDIRLRVDGTAGTDEVFVGIARTADVQTYLAGSDHSVVEDIEDHTAVYRQVTGGEPVADPTEQDFWVASTSGTGEQELEWDARGGRWSIVVMNADGSAGVDADVEFGAKSGAVTPIMITLFVVGGLGLLVTTGLIVWGARGRRLPATGVPGTFTSPLPPPAPGSQVVAASDHDEEHRTPVG